MDIRTIDIKYFHIGSNSGYNKYNHHKQSMPFMCISQIKSGSYRVAIGSDKPGEIAEGGFYVAPPYSLQTVETLSDESGFFHGRWIFFDAYINEKFRLDELFDFPVVLNPDQTGRADGLFDMMFSTSDVCRRYSLLYSLIGIILETGAQKMPASGVLYNVRRYIQNNYMHHLTIAQLASVANISVAGFFPMFRKSFGCTPIEYINRTRLTQSAVLLETTDMSIKDIAVSVGFEDQFYYSKLFSAQYGLSPMQHRKLKRQDKGI